MTVEQRILKCFERVTGAPNFPVKDEKLSVLGLDSLEIMDFLFEVEKEFDVKRLFDVDTSSLRNLTLSDIHNKLLTVIS
jgi:acyl carrier protein